MRSIVSSRSWIIIRESAAFQFREQGLILYDTTKYSVISITKTAGAGSVLARH